MTNATLSDDDRDAIRQWFGASYMFTDKWSKLEDAMRLVEAESTPGAGGNQPNDAAVRRLQAILAQLACLDCGINQNLSQAAVMETSGGTKLDAARAIYMQKQRARELIHRMSSTLSCRPLSDIFSPSDNQYEDGQEEESFSSYGY